MKAGGFGPLELAGLLDADLAAITDGQVPVWNADLGKFVPGAGGSGGSGADLTGVYALKAAAGGDVTETDSGHSSTSGSYDAMSVDVTPDEPVRLTQVTFQTQSTRTWELFLDGVSQGTAQAPDSSVQGISWTVDRMLTAGFRLKFQASSSAPVRFVSGGVAADLGRLTVGQWIEQGSHRTGLLSLTYTPMSWTDLGTL